MPLDGMWLITGFRHKDPNPARLRRRRSCDAIHFTRRAGGCTSIRVISHPLCKTAAPAIVNPYPNFDPPKPVYRSITYRRHCRKLLVSKLHPKHCPKRMDVRLALNSSHWGELSGTACERATSSRRSRDTTITPVEGLKVRILF